MRALAVGLAALLWATCGTGMELAHHAFFSSEPVTLTAPAGTPAPEFRWGGQVEEAEWSYDETDGIVRWRGQLPPDGPLGPWQVCLPDGPCHTFLRVADHESLLIVPTSPGIAVTVGDEEAVVGERGAVFFVLPPGDHTVFISVPELADPIVQEVSLAAGERKETAAGWVELRFSSARALPGYSVAVHMRVGGPVAPHATEMTLDVPAGWQALRDPEVTAPEAAWEVHVPEDYLGEAELVARAPAVGVEGRGVLSVTDELPPEVVTAHWNLVEGRLDLSEFGKVTYDRIRWAFALRGKEMPYTGLIMTRRSWTSWRGAG